MSQFLRDFLPTNVEEANGRLPVNYVKTLLCQSSVLLKALDFSNIFQPFKSLGRYTPAIST